MHRERAVFQDSRAHRVLRELVLPEQVELRVNQEFRDTQVLQGNRVSVATLGTAEYPVTAETNPARVELQAHRERREHQARVDILA